MNKHESTSSDEKRENVLVIEPETKAKTARPPFYRVTLLNDDYTPMDFVVFILKQVFHKGHEEAINVMLEVHNKGAGTCGVFTRDVAETKVEQVVAFARKNEHPLQCVMDKE
jgi:ATP-dependent Clp protease adaptor protein ClpS